VTCASTFPITGGRFAARSSLGPSAASLEAAVAAVRPCAELSSTPKTSAGDRAEMLSAVAWRAGRTGLAAGAGASVVTFGYGSDSSKFRAGRISPNLA
jgi:hypothetical protein